MIVFPLVPYICDFICSHFFWLFCYNFVASSSFVCLFYYNFIARSCILSSFCGLCVVAFKSLRSVCVTVNLLSNLEYMLSILFDEAISTSVSFSWNYYMCLLG